MTTHYEKIQALGNRMASNLETMGVSASFSDGGLTLADKILEIQHQTKGIILSADKSIEQKGTTQNPNKVTLSALVIDENEHIVPDDTPVVWNGVYTTSSWDIDEEELVWETMTLAIGYWGLISTTPDTAFYMGRGSNYFTFYKTSTGWNIACKDNATSTSITGNKLIHAGQGIISNGNGDYVDLATLNGSSASIVSDWEPSYCVGYIGVGTIDFYESSLTENGLATYEYTCSGAGLQQIQAVSGSLQSEPYIVYDGLMTDIGTSDNSSRWSLDSVTYTQSSNNVLLNNTTGSNHYCVPKVNGSSSGYITSSSGVCLECDIKNNNASVVTLIVGGSQVALTDYVSSSDFIHVKIWNNGNTLYYSINNGTTQSKSINYTNSYVQFRVGAGESYYFKNLVIYPI